MISRDCLTIFFKMEKKVNSIIIITADTDFVPVIKDIKAGVFASSPDQIKDLTQKLIEEEVNNHSLSIKLRELQAIISKYERNFNRLPKKSIELAQYQRNRESFQQLYLLVEQKYQEAMINELSQPENVVIIGHGRVPDEPTKPKRIWQNLLWISYRISGGCDSCVRP